MLTNLLMLNFTEADLEPQYWERLKAHSSTLVLSAEDSPDLDGQLGEADALLLKLGMGADQALIDRAPNLRYIGMLGTGTGRIDSQYAASKEIVVCNVADYSTQGVAEFTFACLLEHTREICRARTQGAAGDYSEATYTGTEIYGKTLGVVGLGHIGRRVAELASVGFGARTIYWSRSPKDLGPESKIQRVELAELLEQSDIVSLHLEHNPDTDQLLSTSSIAAIKPGAIVINTAPMEILDLDALETRLAKDDITFILDHSDELSDSDAARLRAHENCVIYPPIAYTTVEATDAKQDIFVGNIEHFLQGAPTNRVN